MNSDTFNAILSELSQVKTWSKEQASTLLEKAKSVFGDGMNNNYDYNKKSLNYGHGYPKSDSLKFLHMS